MIAAYGNSYSYDSVGNMTSRTVGGTTYTLMYDAENRMTGVSGGGISATFVYDADGNRVLGTVDGTTTVYIAGVYEYQAGATTHYYEGPTGNVALRRAGHTANNGVFYLLGDHLGSTSVLVNQNGTLNSTNYYYPYGSNRGGAQSTLTAKRYTGQYHESGLAGSEGLYYYGARWYDPQLARFAQADTIVPDPGSAMAFNRYMYVAGNPLRLVDPSGHRYEEGAGFSTCNGICTDRNGYAIVATQRERHQIRNNRRRFMNALAWVPYLDTGEDLAVLTTGCGFSCQAGYEKPVGTGWRVLAGVALVAPFGFRPAKTAINAITNAITGHGNEVIELAKQALKAQKLVGQTPTGRVFASLPDGSVRTRSGWKTTPKGHTQGTDTALQYAAEIGNPFKKTIKLDHGKVGRYNATHAEAQIGSLVTDAQAIGVSRTPCSSCQGFFQKRAQYEGKITVIASPEFIDVYYPNTPFQRIRIQ